MTIKTFIEKAIEGGWNGKYAQHYIKSEMWRKEKGTVLPNLKAQILLDPLAWKAVGKVEGWGETGLYENNNTVKFWQLNMHRMIDALAEGKTIEQFLETL